MQSPLRSMEEARHVDPLGTRLRTGVSTGGELKATLAGPASEEKASERKR